MPTTLITGTNRGIGLELVRQYARDGWRVHACCRRPDAATDLAGIAAAAEGRIAVHALDVTDGAQIRAIAQRLEGEPIDVLINNAGVYGKPDGAFGAVDDKVWLYTLKVNTMAPLHVSEAFVDHVAASKRKLIAVMTSKMGSIDDNSSGGHYVYRSSKAALNIIARSMAIDLRDRGITIITIHPGWVRTDMGGRSAPLSVERSVTGIRQVIDRTGLDGSGRFLAWDGTEIPW